MSIRGLRKFQCKKSLEDTLAKCRVDIEKIQEAGSYPHDYSLGWTNAMIFVLHRLNGQADQPKFYDRKTSIGELPRPMRFEHEAKEFEAERQEFEILIAQLEARAKDVVYAKENNKHIDEVFLAILKLSDALKELKAFADDDNLDSDGSPGGKA